jgi:hypothetical protein
VIYFHNVVETIVRALKKEKKNPFLLILKELRTIFEPICRLGVIQCKVVLNLTNRRASGKTKFSQGLLKI